MVGGVLRGQHHARRQEGINSAEISPGGGVIMEESGGGVISFVEAGGIRSKDF